MGTLTVSTTATAAGTAVVPAPTLAPQVQQQHSPTSPSTTRAPSLSEQIQQPQQGQLALPIANAGISKTVNENTKVTLDARASYSPNSGGKIVAYQWTQLHTGVPITLSGANTPTPTFTAPVVTIDTVLGFSLRVMDNHGSVSTNTAAVYVMIKHHTAGVANSHGTNTASGSTSQQLRQNPSTPLPPPILVR
jgi:hypothetical protein